MNPIRYRGYYYDTETKLYYLQSRYYNSEWGRFISADVYCDTQDGILGTNMYAYCQGDPVNAVDPSGMGPVNSIAKFLFKQSDDRGIDILWHWLYGKGELLTFDNVKVWSDYMMKNNLLTNGVKSILLPIGNGLGNGKSIPIFLFNMPMEVENGESINGYMFLHGTLYFSMFGTISKDMKGNVTYDMTYLWIDEMDPNGQYWTDKVKSFMGELVTFGGAKDYWIRIMWKDKSVINANGVGNTGWLR